jgi:signal transduction histidine kinase
VATVLDPALLHDVTAVLRESLTNVVKHSNCSAVAVHVTVTPTVVAVEVIDNGSAPVLTTAPPGGRPHRGLDNLSSRARARHGECTLTTDERGTVLSWSARPGR